MTNQNFSDDENRWSELMFLAQQGQKEPYETLLKELSKAIAAYLRCRFGNTEFIDDCVQESLMAIHQARNTYKPKLLFRPWLFAIVRNKAIDILRKNKKHHNKSDEETLINKASDACVEDDINKQQLLKALSPKCREALTLTKFIGMSNSEAANKLAISEGAMKLRVHRAIKETKKLLQADPL